ncbi:MAG: hypothetical protein QOH25_3886 [Acidobacteriota bacterium]|jgi:hypothetical protein|nr:hypothetical protein [Acidobacteriota bacterium]
MNEKLLPFIHPSSLILHPSFPSGLISERSHRLQLRGQWRLRTAFPLVRRPVFNSTGALHAPA